MMLEDVSHPRGTAVAVSADRAPAPVLSVEAVSLRWPGAQMPTLDGVQFAVEAGAAIGIIGANGAGKTTLLRIVAGLIRPQHGRATVCGTEIDQDRAAYIRRIGFLPAGNTGLYARLTVDDNLDFWARLCLLPRRRRDHALKQAGELFALRELGRQRVDRLSMGQRQRVRLAMAFLHDPELVLLDEPCTSLDGAGIGMIEEALRRLRARGGAAVICSPDSESARLPIDRDLVLSGGRLHAT